MKLTEIEYNVIMRAINDAKNAIEDGTFCDPYDATPDDTDVTYTDEIEILLTALNSVEDKIMSENIV